MSLGKRGRIRKLAKTFAVSLPSETKQFAKAALTRAKELADQRYGFSPSPAKTKWLYKEKLKIGRVEAEIWAEMVAPGNVGVQRVIVAYRTATPRRVKAVDADLVYEYARDERAALLNRALRSFAEKHGWTDADWKTFQEQALHGQVGFILQRQWDYQSRSEKRKAERMGLHQLPQEVESALDEVSRVYRDGFSLLPAIDQERARALNTLRERAFEARRRERSRVSTAVRRAEKAKSGEQKAM